MARVVSVHRRQTLSKGFATRNDEENSTTFLSILEEIRKKQISLRKRTWKSRARPLFYFRQAGCF